MKNKIYLCIIAILIPLTILSFKKVEDKLEVKDELYVRLKLNDEIITLPINDYLIGVVAQEMPASFNDEAIKAQIIASRTFALYQLQYKDYLTTGDQAYITMEQMKQKWDNEFDTYYNKIKNLVEETEDLVLTYDNELIKSYYYAMSNGLTEDSLIVFNEDLPYINVVDSSYDNSSINKFLTEVKITKKEFCNKLNISCDSINITNKELDDSNRVLSITINNKVFKGTEIRSLLGLRSTDFSITIDDNVTITTKGYGHGVGMSQYGANGMANDNKTYDEILKHFYQNIEITKYNV